jgi:CubicO group peptidase (beta-lactamase class C family)
VRIFNWLKIPGASGLFFCSFIIFLSAACGGCLKRSGNELDSKVQGVMEGPFTRGLHEALSRHHVPAVSVAVVHDLKIEWARAYGNASAKTDIPIDADTLFPASSITKAVSSATALNLVDKGVLALDRDVNLTLHSWKLPDSPLTAGSKVTLRQLLSHTAGINRPKGGFGHEGGFPTTIQVLNGEKPATNPPVAIEFTPGSRFAYSNFGYVIVQQLAEDAAGRPFPVLVQEHVLSPARMESSTLEQPLPARFSSRAASPHDESGNTRDLFFNPNAVAQGGLWTTPSDLAAFMVEIMRAARGDSERIFSRTAIHEMLTPHYRGLEGAEHWGLGFIVLGDWAILQAGSDPGFRCLMAAFPKSGQGIVVMLNGENGEFLQLRLLLNFLLEYIVRPSAISFMAGGTSFLVLLLACTGWPTAAAYRRLRKRRRLFAKASSDPNREGRAARLLAVLTAIVILGTSYPYILACFQPGGLAAQAGSTFLARSVLWMSLFGAALSLATATASAGLWKNRTGSRVSRVIFSGVAVAALVSSFFWLTLAGML